MHWIRLAAIVGGAGVLTTFTDWILAGDWIQKHYKYPEIWRKDSGILAFAIATALPFLTCAAFTALALKLQLEGVRNCAKLAIAIWVIGPLPLIITNAVFIKLQRVFVALYCAAWLVKLMIVAVLVGKFLR